MLIYLADTVHSSSDDRLNPDTVPYNVARIAAYAASRHPEHDYRIFKDPHILLDVLRTERPDVLALSHYFWNTRLNHRIARYARELHPPVGAEGRPQIVIVTGPNLDRDKDAYVRYSEEHPYVDFVIVEEGETAFYNILESMQLSNPNRSSEPLAVRNPSRSSVSPPGTFAIHGPGEISVGASQPRVRDLDEFPSPYLNGMLDPFLAQGLRPILETVRGCPYRCAFCEQGSEFFTKIAQLSFARVTAELDYIRARARHPELILADVNFGILKRDLDVATLLKQSHLQHGWPKSLYVYNAKQPTETTLRTMETLYPMAQLCMSFQSTDKTVLENIHRANIGYDKYSFITKWAKARNLPVGTELIYGLPGETRESFINGYETLLNFRADYMASYNLRLFPGIELNRPAERIKYGVKTAFRPMDVNLGEYQFTLPAAISNPPFESVPSGGRNPQSQSVPSNASNPSIKSEHILEIEEIVLSNSTLTEDDYFHTRKLAFLVEALWNTGYLRPALAFLANHGFKITEILQDILRQPSELFEEYDTLARQELSPCEVSNPSSASAPALKLNLAFAGKLLLFSNPYDNFFYNYLQSLIPTLPRGQVPGVRSNPCAASVPCGVSNPGSESAPFQDVLAHCRASKVDLDNPEPRNVTMAWNVPAWVQATYPIDISPYLYETTCTYSLSPDILTAALQTKNRLERQGAPLNHIAERIFMETPAAHRGTRTCQCEEETQNTTARHPLLETHDNTAPLPQRMQWTA